MLNITDYVIIVIIHIQFSYFGWRNDKNIVIDTSRINAYILFLMTSLLHHNTQKIITFKVGIIFCRTSCKVLQYVHQQMKSLQQKGLNSLFPTHWNIIALIRRNDNQVPFLQIFFLSD